MLIVLGGAAIAIYIWAWWLVRSKRAPRWLHWVGTGVALSTICCAGYTVFALTRAFHASADINPAEKSSYLAHGISDAMSVLAIGLVIAGVGAIACAFFTLRPRHEHHQPPQG